MFDDLPSKLPHLTPEEEWELNRIFNKWFREYKRQHRRWQRENHHRKRSKARKR